MSSSPTGALDDPPVPQVVLAAGVVCWRPAGSQLALRHHDPHRAGTEAGGTGEPRLEVLVVHRPRYDDWSWPKGKLEPGETLPECAVRETTEETGASVVLGLPLLAVEYQLPDGRPKRVTYWVARSVRRGFRSAPLREIDDVCWLPVEAARERLTRSTDLAPLEALVTAARQGLLAARPVMVVRHATARPRDAWAQADADRPLVASGRRQALALAGLLRCWRPERVVSSPWRRCLETIGPYVAAHGARVRTKGGLSEDGFGRDPTKAGRHVARLLSRDQPALLCTHRPVLGAVLDVLRDTATEDIRALIPSTDPFLAPGEVLVAHTVTDITGPHVVAVERHAPPR